MAALLGLAQAVLLVTDTALAACATLLFIVYVVRLVAGRGAGSSAPIRANRMNIKLLIVIYGVLGAGWISFWGVGEFTNRPLLSLLGYLFLSLYVTCVMAMVLSQG